jgi:hypothetical protein
MDGNFDCLECTVLLAEAIFGGWEDFDNGNAKSSPTITNSFSTDLITLKLELQVHLSLSRGHL